VTEAILDKVRKLLAKAEDPGCTPAEAEALTDKAAQLIAKYGVDRALLAAAAPETDPLGDRVVDIGPPYALDKAGLLATVAGALRCRSVRRKRPTSQGYSYAMHLFGYASDLERVELLFTSLLVQASLALSVAEIPEWDSVAAFRRSWLAGFAFAIGERLRLAEQRAQTAPEVRDGPSVALVLADRTDRVDRRVEAAYPQLRTSAPRRLMGSGLDGGYAAGQQADLGGLRLMTPERRRVSR
jgi:hypothetical protein